MDVKPSPLGYAAGLLAALALLTGCSGSASRDDERQPGAALRGGTLRVGADPFGVGADDTLPGSAQYALDPQFEYFQAYFELYRCCLLRTLLSYNGRPSDQGGGILRPDLASAPPTVSPDGLTWRFRLRRGLHYAPPFQRTEITSADIVRALEREFRLGHRANYAFYYTVIQGTRAFADGRASAISGLETPDRYTLVVHVTHPTGDLGYRFSLAASAPIPPGADRGHDGGYGRFLVSSGPYMIAGSQRMDFSRSPRQQRPAAGWRYRYTVRRGRVVLKGPETLTLVRNPSWRRETDPLRAAYPDRIAFTMSTEHPRLARLVEQGSLDVLLDQTLPLVDLRRARKAPRLEQRLHVNSVNALSWVTINLAEPPFDDVHVRRALAFALNKAAVIRIENRSALTTGFLYDVTATHALPDSFENGLLAGYDPYATPGERGNPAAARAEMAHSRYDRNHDGRCDARACRAVLSYGTSSDVSPSLRPLDREIARDVRTIGLRLVVRHGTLKQQVAALTPGRHVALLLFGGWLADFPDGATFTPILQRPTDAVNNDFSLLGATRQELRKWGYRARSVPSVDGEIERCLSEAGEQRAECWAKLDQRLMERIVPYVPYGHNAWTGLTSARVARFSFDQFGAAPALDRIALRPGFR